MTEFAAMQTTDPPELMQPHEVAAVLGITPDTLRRWANEGVLPSQRSRPGGHRRFRRADVEALIKAANEPTAAAS